MDTFTTRLEEHPLSTLLKEVRFPSSFRDKIPSSDEVVSYIVISNNLGVAANLIIQSRKFSFRSCEIAYNSGRGSLGKTIEAITMWVNDAEFDVHKTIQQM